MENYGEETSGAREDSDENDLARVLPVAARGDPVSPGGCQGMKNLIGYRE